MNIREYTLHLLKSCGCDLNCYAETSYVKGHEIHSGFTDALNDLKSMVEAGEKYDFPLEDIAKELVAIGNEQPLPPRRGHKLFSMVYDMGDTVDGVEHDTFEAAKDDALETLANWVAEEQKCWKVDENGTPHPTERQVESWDKMIEDYCVYIVRWDDEANDYESCDDAWYPSSEDEKDTDWLYWEELKAKYGW